MFKTRNVGQEMHRNMQLCSAVGNPYYYTKHHRGDCGLVQSESGAPNEDIVQNHLI